MKKIESLTKDQEKYLIEFRKKWLDIGLCCEPANFDRAEEQITFFYKKLGKKKPMFFKFSSPLTAELGCQVLDYMMKNPKQFFGDNLRDNLRANLGDNLGDNLWDNLGANLGANLRDNLGDNLGDNLWDNLGDNLWANLRDNLRDNLRTNLWDNLWANLGANLWANLRDNLRTNLWDNLGDNLRDNLGANLWDNLKFSQKFFIQSYHYYGNLGQMDAPWIAFYKFGQELGVKYKDSDIELLNAWGALSESACWWMPYENICIISDRPSFISKDEAGRLHSETRMAVEFRDGYGVYMWHGIEVPSEWITDKKSLTPEIALQWKNVEQRRAACELLGWAHILDKLKAKVIDTDDDEEIGELVEVEIPDIGREKFLRVLCGTKRKFALPVPPNMKTALEANSWTYNLDGNTLRKLEVRT